MIKPQTTKEEMTASITGFFRPFWDWVQYLSLWEKYGHIAPNWECSPFGEVQDLILSK